MFRRLLPNHTPRRKLSRRHSTFSSAYIYGPNSLGRCSNRNAPVDVHPEVQDALNNNRAVVALESTIITHGMPPPTNYETAQAVESIVRSTGSVPATIGIIDGRVKIGLQSSELERLADVRTSSPVKVSRRDIGACLALKKNGGTTCSATLIFASLAGIKVFSTGGLGGVHRGGQDSLDVSADLHELSRCPLALVSAGVKSILDIGRTLEYLETLGVPVVTYGATHDFPAFYSASSGFKSPWRVDSPRAAADILMAQWQLGMDNGVLFGAPLPVSYSAGATDIQAAVEQAIEESEEKGISRRGNEVTPWLLHRVEELTAGKSLQSNIALIENTAAIGGKIAMEFETLQSGLYGDRVMDKQNRPHKTHRPVPLKSSRTIRQTDLTSSGNNQSPAALVIIGSAAVDVIATGQDSETGIPSSAHSTSPGKITFTVGGVGRNIAEAAHRILNAGSDARADTTLLVSPIARDGFADKLVMEHQQLKMRTDGFIRLEGAQTAACSMVLDGYGSLIGGIADMDITRNLTGEQVKQAVGHQRPALLVVDGNLSSKTLTLIVNHWNEYGTTILFEPTSVAKSVSILPAVQTTLSRIDTKRSAIAYATPNLLELAHIYKAASSDVMDLVSHKAWGSIIHNFGLGHEWRIDLSQLAKQPACPRKSKGNLSFLVDEGVAQMAITLLPFFQNLVIKCGERGVFVAMRLMGKDTAWTEMCSDPLQRFIIARSLDDSELVVVKHFPAINIDSDKIINVTGAGDSFVGALCAGLVRSPKAMLDPGQLDTLMNMSQQAAAFTIQSPYAVSPLLEKVME